MSGRDIKAMKERRERPDSLVRGLRILVVDDNELTRDLSAMILEKHHKVASAANGLEALDALSRGTFDLVLMDMQMPVMDGCSATRIIRRVEEGVRPDGVADELRTGLSARLAGKHLLVFAMSADSRREDRELCFVAGMDGHIRKPLVEAELLVILQSLRDVSHGGAPCLQSDAGQRAGCDGSPSVEEAVSFLQANSGGSRKAAVAILERAVNQMRETLGSLKSAFEAGDGEKFSENCHFLKGLFLQCGMGGCAVIVQDLDDTGIFSDRDEGGAGLLQQLQHLVDNFAAENLGNDEFFSDQESVTAMPVPANFSTGQEAKRILLMDDNELIRDVVGEMLSMFGFEVGSVMDGATAVQMYAESIACGKPFACALLDLRVPDGMGGLETAEKILELDGNACLVLCSGDTHAAASFKKYGFRRSLAKPHTFDMLKDLFEDLGLM